MWPRPFAWWSGITPGINPDFLSFFSPDSGDGLYCDGWAGYKPKKAPQVSPGSRIPLLAGFLGNGIQDFLKPPIQ
jgi:hypothetical protein